MTENDVDRSLVPAACPFEKWNVPKEDDVIIKEFSKDGDYIVCLPCSKYSIQVSRRMKTIEDEGNSGLVKSYPNRPKFDGGAWSAWEYHKTKSKIHTECCRRHFDKDKDWPSDSAIAPKINTFFSPVKRKSLSNDIEAELPSKKVKAKDHLPFWRKACNGIIPTMQLLDIKYNGSNVVRNRELRDAMIVENKYVRSSDKYEIRPIGKSSTLSMFSKECSADIRFYSDSKKPGQYGVRCMSCENLRLIWSNGYFRKQRQKLIERSKKLDECSKIASGDVLVDITSKVTATKLNSIYKIHPQHLTEEGKYVRSSLKHFETIAQSMNKDRKKYQFHSDPFVRKFIAFWDNNKKFRDSLAVQLLEINIARISGHKNSRIPQRLLDFFSLLHSYDRKTSMIVSSNLCGPNLRTLLAKAKQQSGMAFQCNFIMRDKSHMAKIVEDHIRKLFPNTDISKKSRVTFSVAVDATKVAKLLQICTKYNAVLGGTAPHHFVLEESGEGENTLEKLKSILQNKEIVKADEIKVAVLSFQNTGNQSPYLILGGQPQTTNKVTTFNDDVYDACQLAVDSMNKKGSYLVHFASVSSDGVTSDTDVLKRMQTKALNGENEFFALTDIPHNVKNLRYQYVGLASVVAIGRYVLDAGLLPEAGVEVEVFRVKDWASDTVVLRAISLKTCVKIMNATVRDEKTRTTLLISLLFPRLHISAIQVKSVLKYKTRIRMLWSSMLFVLHMDGVSVITKRNMIMGTIGTAFLLMTDDMVNINLSTTESCEHTFGHARYICKEFTVRDFCWIVEKIARRFELLHRNGFNLHRDASKGYNLQGGTNKSSNKKGSGGPVNIFERKNEESVSAFIWKHLRPIVNEINAEMRNFLANNFGVQIFHVMTKEFKDNENNTPADLLQEFLNCMDNIEKFHFESKENSNGETQEGRNDDTDQNTDADTINIEEYDKITEAYIERLVEANRNLAENTDESVEDEEYDSAINDQSEEIADNDNDVTAVEDSENENLLDEVDNALTTLLQCKSLEEISFAKMKTNDDRIETSLIQGLFEAFHMKNRDQGTVSNAQRHKGLVVRYSDKKEKVDTINEDKDGTGKFIQRGSVLRVKLKGDDREKQFVVLALSDKFYGKWYMNEKGFKLPWVPQKMKNVKTRLIARELVMNKTYGILDLKPYNEIEDLRSIHYRKHKPYILIEKIHEEVIDVLDNTMEL